MSNNVIKLIQVFLRMRLGKPTFVSFNSLNDCNEACPMCAVWRRGGEMLTVEEMEPIFRDLRSFGFMVTEISGGEPFLREDIHDVIALFDRLGFLYTITTNGTLLTTASLERLRAAKGLLQLAVSIDSLDRSTYECLRGRDLLPVVLQNLEMLRAARLNIPVKLNLVMNRLNFRETFDLLSFAKERGLYLSVFPVNQGEGFSHRHGDNRFLTTEDEARQMADIFLELARMRRAGEPLWEYSGFYDLAAGYILGNRVGPCDAGRLYLDLHADGHVAVCPDRAGVGDLRNTSLRDLWPLLRAEKPAIKACSETSPCLYTCTYNISLTARNEAAFLWETTRVRLRRFMTPRG